MTIKLPKDFFFGAAMSGPQTEGAWNVGGRLRSYWDMYSDQEINAFFNNVGSYVGNDMYHKYEEDIIIYIVGNNTIFCQLRFGYQ